MMPLLIEMSIGALVVALVFCYLLLKRRYEFWRKLGVVGPKPDLVFGNSWNLFKLEQTEADLADQIYRDFPGERYVGFYNLWKPALLLRDLSLVKTVMGPDFLSFSEHAQVSSGQGSDGILSSLFFMKEEKWKSRREMFTKLFTPRQIKEHAKQFKEHLNIVLLDLKAHQGKPVDVVSFFDRYSAQFITHAFYGINLLEDAVLTEKFLDLAEVLTHPSPDMVIKFMFYNISPFLHGLLGLKTFPPKLWDFYYGITKALLAARKVDDVRNDLITLLNKHTREGFSNNGKMDINEATAHVYVWFAASHHTTAVTICHLLYHLSVHPEVQEKVHQELERELSCNEVSYEDLAKLTYLDCVVKESMRLETLVGVVKRICTKDYKLEDGLTLPKGIEVFIPVLSLQRDPDYFPDPEVFRPERFAEGETSQAYMPFGAGPRVCIGKKFAEVIVRMLIAGVLMQYRLVPAERKPIKYDPRTVFITNRPDSPVWINFLPRSQPA